MADRRRPLSSLTSGDFDHPPATISISDSVTERLDRLRRSLERQRVEYREQSTASSRHERVGPSVLGRRRRLVRPTGAHSPTYEGRIASHDEESADEAERPRRAKRPRLDLYHPPPEINYPKYGHYGQVEPGRLRLEMCNFDGGTHNAGGPIHYGPHNILKHDQSVYSSQDPTCNILLRHLGGAPFTIDKVIVMAPAHGFTAPVQSGRVCIGTELDALYALRADQLLYDTDETSSACEEDDDDTDAGFDVVERLAGGGGGGDELMSSDSRGAARTSRQALSIPEPLPAANVLGRRAGRVWPSPPHWPPLQPTARREQSSSGQSRSALRSRSPAVTSVRLETGVNVSIGCDEEVSWPEDPTDASTLADRARRMRDMMQDEDVATQDERRRAWDPRYRSEFNRLRRGTRGTQPMVYDSSGHHGSSNALSNSDQRPLSRNVHEVPFRIEPGKTKVAIKFEPLVSCRYLLLQLQSGRRDLNVDVQTVIACGYAGTRFLPAIQMR